MKSTRSLMSMDATSLRRLVARQQVKLARTPLAKERAVKIKQEVYEAATFWGRWTKVADAWMVLCSVDASIGDIVLVERRDGDAQEHVVERVVKVLGKRQIVQVVK